MNSSADTHSSGDLHMYRRLLRYMLPYSWAFILSVLGFFLFSGMQVLLADILQLLVDTVGDSDNLRSGIISEWVYRLGIVQGNNIEQLRIVIPVAMMLIVVFRGTGYFFGTYCMAYVGRHVVHDLRCGLFNHNVRLPVSYFETGTSAHVVSRITFNVEQVTGAVTNALKIIIREGIYIVFLLSYLLLLNWRLCLVFIAVAPFIALVVKYTSARFRRISRRIQNSMGDVTHVTSEVVNANRIMRIFGGEDYETTRFKSASFYNKVQSLKMALTSSISAPLIQFFVGAALCFLIWMMLHPSVLAVMTPGQFVAFITAAGMLAKPVRQLSEVQATIQMGLAAAQDIFYQLDLELEDDAGEEILQAPVGKVSFHNVCFAYSKDNLVLKNISIDVKAGQTVALVGSSGGGKTTLVSLLPRFYNPTSGKITIDGVDTRNIRLDDLRSHIALVSQNVVLFNDTIRRNIAYGQLQSASDAQIQDAAKRAYAHNFIEQFEDGYDTIVGDNGILLSGGQRQRIAISRALLKDAPILIFDEATSALDNESERAIQADMEKMMRSRTTFVIAHRLSTVEKADVILVLEEGQIVEQGTHQELLALHGRYKHLHQIMSTEPV